MGRGALTDAAVVTPTLCGPTLADMRGPRRYRRLRDSADNLLDQVIERLESIMIIRAEMAELEPAYLRGLVDRPGKGELKKGDWI